MEATKTNRITGVIFFAAIALFSVFGCSAGKEPAVNQNQPTVEELRAETERRDAIRYEVGARSFAVAQERIALYTREEAERRQARREYDEKMFWEKQRRARQ